MDRMRRIIWLVTAYLAWAGLSGRAAADMTVTLQPTPGVYASVIEDYTVGFSMTLRDKSLTHNVVTGVGGKDVVEENGLLQFDLSSIPNPSSWRVALARVTLYQELNSAPGAVFDLFRNTTTWSSPTVTWASRPSYASAPVASITLGGTPGTFYSFDVTSVVGAWLGGSQPDFGFTFKRMDNTNSGVFFSSGASDTAAFRPELTLVLVSVPEPSALGLIASGLVGLSIYARRRLAAADT
jgi:hypothetical protein